MNKLYNKIYPTEPEIMDNKIFQKTSELSNVETKLIINKDYIFDIMLPDILNEFKQLDIAKTPYEKLESVSTIFNYIESLIKFNEGEDKEIGAEETDPVLIYILIKAHPERIYTDVEFIRIFTEKKRNAAMLTRVENIYNSIVNNGVGNFEINQEKQ